MEQIKIEIWLTEFQLNALDFAPCTSNDKKEEIQDILAKIVRAMDGN